MLTSPLPPAPCRSARVARVSDEARDDVPGRAAAVAPVGAAAAHAPACAAPPAPPACSRRPQARPAQPQPPAASPTCSARSLAASSSISLSLRFMASKSCGVTTAKRDAVCVARSCDAYADVSLPLRVALLEPDEQEAPQDRQAARRTHFAALWAARAAVCSSVDGDLLLELAIKHLLLAVRHAAAAAASAQPREFRNRSSASKPSVCGGVGVMESQLWRLHSAPVEVLHAEVLQVWPTPQQKGAGRHRGGAPRVGGTPPPLRAEACWPSRWQSQSSSVHEMSAAVAGAARSPVSLHQSARYMTDMEVSR